MVTARPRGLAILDRDGVLNKMTIDPEHGTLDSPLHPTQIQMASQIAQSLKRIADAGYLLAVATNQPAAAKGKTTVANLEAVMKQILEQAQSEGARVETWRMCLHQGGDGCACRKPKPGMLLEIIAEIEAKYGALDRTHCWMVGDGITDLQAGRAAGVRVGLLAPKKLDAVTMLHEADVEPDFWGEKLADFAQFIAVR